MTGMGYDTEDIIGICEICSTGIMAGEEVKDDDVFYHHRCMEKAAKEAYREHAEARGIDSIKPYEVDIGGD